MPVDSTLSAGAYTFFVRATDSVLNTDQTPASRAFTVDSTPPDTTITGGPNPVGNNASPSLSFNSTEANSTFECKLDTSLAPGTYASCTSPKPYTSLADGSYTFSVRATDTALNTDPTPATRAFTIDTNAPELP